MIATRRRNRSISSAVMQEITTFPPRTAKFISPEFRARSAARSAAARGRWKLCSVWRGVLHLHICGRSSAPHPAEPDLPRARAKLRALRSAARFAAASGRWKLCSMRRGASSSSHPREEAPRRIRQSRIYLGASRASRTLAPIIVSRYDDLILEISLLVPSFQSCRRPIRHSNSNAL